MTLTRRLTRLRKAFYAARDAGPNHRARSDAISLAYQRLQAAS